MSLLKRADLDQRAINRLDNLDGVFNHFFLLEAEWMCVASWAVHFEEHGVVCTVACEVLKRNRELECAQGPILRLWNRLHSQVITQELNEVGWLAIG